MARACASEDLKIVAPRQEVKKHDLIPLHVTTMNPVHGTNKKKRREFLGGDFMNLTRCFSSPRRPHRFWGPQSLISNGYLGLFPPG
jgi:hypothetical protein